MINRILNRLQGDKIIWLVVFLITMVSLLAVYTGASAPILREKGSSEYYLFKHFMLLAVGFLVMYVIHRFDYRIFGKISNFLLFITVPVLLYTLLMGTVVNDAARWIKIFGQSFQPSDLGKVALMVFLAKILARKQDVIRDFRRGFLPVVAWVIAICMLIAPADLSTASLLFLSSLMLMFIAGVDLKYIGSLILIGLLSGFILFNVADRSGTWAQRWGSFVEQVSSDDYTPPYQVEQAFGAMASGGFFGKGVGKSTQRNFLPNSTSDMIYPVIIEEHGFLGGLIVLILYLLLLIRSVAIVTVSKTFGALLAAGLSFMLVLQALTNMAVSVHLLPVTGLPLPMISMGGTSILFTSLAIGIILSVSRHAHAVKKEAIA